MWTATAISMRVCALEFDVNRLYVNDGAGRFTWKRDVFTAERNDSEEVELADFDADGRQDVLFIAEHGGNHELYLGEGDGAFRDVSGRLLGRTVANDAATGDVNGDGGVDVIVGNTGAESSGDDADVADWETVQRNFLWLGDRERPGHFIDVTADHMPPVRDATQDVKLGDLDGDGSFADRTDHLDLPVPLETREVVLFDADGDPDLLLCAVQIPGFHPLQVRAYRNDGTGHFTDVTGRVISKETVGRGWDVEVGDVNGTGALDVFIGGWGTQARLLFGRISQPRSED